MEESQQKEGFQMFLRNEKDEKIQSGHMTLEEAVQHYAAGRSPLVNLNLMKVPWKNQGLGPAIAFHGPEEVIPALAGHPLAASKESTWVRRAWIQAIVQACIPALVDSHHFPSLGAVYETTLLQDVKILCPATGHDSQPLPVAKSEGRNCCLFGGMNIFVATKGGVLQPADIWVVWYFCSREALPDVCRHGVG